GRNVVDAEGVAVRGGLNQLREGNDAASAGNIFNDELLAKRAAEIFSHQAGERVCRTTGPIGHHDPDRLAWPVILGCRCGRDQDGGRQKPSNEQMLRHIYSHLHFSYYSFETSFTVLLSNNLVTPLANV